MVLSFTRIYSTVHTPTVRLTPPCSPPPHSVGASHIHTTYSTVGSKVPLSLSPSSSMSYIPKHLTSSLIILPFSHSATSTPAQHPQQLPAMPGEAFIHPEDRDEEAPRLTAESFNISHGKVRYCSVTFLPFFIAKLSGFVPLPTAADQPVRPAMPLGPPADSRMDGASESSAAPAYH